LADDFIDRFSTIIVFAAVVIAGRGEQQLWFDLSKSLNHSAA
jgi:hypothetical protein